MGVWEFNSHGKSLRHYLKSIRIRATSDKYTYNYRSPNWVTKDPIFSVDGHLVFNWLYRDNGVRIGVSGNYRGSGRLPKYPGDDTFVGLGNSFDKGRGNGKWRHDVGVYRGYKQKSSRGTDHGSQLASGKMEGQYAIFVSDSATRFPCTSEHRQLQVVMIEIAPTVAPSSPTLAPSPLPYRQFGFIDLNVDGLLDFAEIAFDNADTDKDGCLSFQEFNATLQVVHVKGE